MALLPEEDDPDHEEQNMAALRWAALVCSVVVIAVFVFLAFAGY
jgi:hypothetical protein